MVFDAGGPALATDVQADGALADESVLLLTRDAGFAEIAALDFTHTSGPVLFGSRKALLEKWRAKLAGTE